ncbi:MAG: hypothetical protein COB04_18665 [Gammaproteobacteria bacterium]|nr:MAG: hypothetical protein COB04_18665 [Gammaproteobacteria bacterium]
MNAEFKFDFEAVKNMMETQFSDFNELGKDMGFEPVEATGEKVVIKIPFNPLLADHRGALHGGTITTLLDTASGMCIFLKTQTLTPMATLDLRVEYLQPVTPGLGIIAEVSCYHTCDMLANVRGLAYHESSKDPVVSFSGAFMMNTSGPDFFKFPGIG